MPPIPFLPHKHEQHCRLAALVIHAAPGPSASNQKSTTRPPSGRSMTTSVIRRLIAASSRATVRPGAGETGACRGPRVDRRCRVADKTIELFEQGRGAQAFEDRPRDGRHLRADP